MHIFIRRKLEHSIDYHKVDFRIKNITRNKQGHYLLMKRPIHQEAMYVEALLLGTYICRFLRFPW